MYKKLTAIILVIVLLSLAIPSTANNAYQSNNENLFNHSEDLFFYLEPCDQIFFDTSEMSFDEIYEYDSVIIVFNRAASRVASMEGRDFTAGDFNDIGVSYVKPLSYLSDIENTYAQQFWEAEHQANVIEYMISEQRTNDDDNMLSSAYEYAVYQYERARELLDEHTLLNADAFRKILSVRLDQNCRDNLLSVISQLQQREYIYWVGPSAYIEPDSTTPVIPIDHYFPLPPADWYYQWSVRRLSLPYAWSFTTGNSAIRVGIIGSIIDETHPELVGRVRTDLGGIFYENSDNPPFCFATEQAGIIGAMGDNGIGIAGIAWNVELVPLRIVRNSGQVNLRDSIAAINHARHMNIPILNHSFSLINYTPFFVEIANYNGLFVNSAGNDNRNWDNHSWRPPSLSNLIIVGASTRVDRRFHAPLFSSSSNFGLESVHVFAPGDVRTTRRPTAADNSRGYLFGWYTQTSAAAPHVAGVAALVMSVNPALSAQEVKEIIIESADHIDDLVPYVRYGRRLNAYGAVKDAVARWDAHVETASVWARPYIQKLWDSGAITRNTTAIFRDYQQPITRLHAAQIMDNLAFDMAEYYSYYFDDRPYGAVPNVSPFLDINENFQPHDAILRLNNIGVALGYKPDFFMKHNCLVRQHIASLFHRMIGYFRHGDTNFNYGGKIASHDILEQLFWRDHNNEPLPRYLDTRIQCWAMDAVSYLTCRGYMVGITNNRFGAQNTMTVQEMLVLAARAHMHQQERLAARRGDVAA